MLEDSQKAREFLRDPLIVYCQFADLRVYVGDL